MTKPKRSSRPAHSSRRPAKRSSRPSRKRFGNEDGPGLRGGHALKWSGWLRRQLKGYPNHYEATLGPWVYSVGPLDAGNISIDLGYAVEKAFGTSLVWLAERAPRGKPAWEVYIAMAGTKEEALAAAERDAATNPPEPTRQPRSPSLKQMARAISG